VSNSHDEDISITISCFTPKVRIRNAASLCSRNNLQSSDQQAGVTICPQSLVLAKDSKAQITVEVLPSQVSLLLSLLVSFHWCCYQATAYQNTVVFLQRQSFAKLLLQVGACRFLLKVQPTGFSPILVPLRVDGLPLLSNV
jgi:hypothetical protein